MKTFKCADVGLNCPFVAKEPTEDELMIKIKKHASEVHNMNNVSPEMMDKIKNAIKEET